MDKTRQRKSPARELEACILAHADLADLALAILRDKATDIAAKSPVIAAARYGFEDLDLIQDEVPNYGLIDDLFVLAHGLDRFLRSGSPRAAAYASAQVGGEPVLTFLTQMRDRFYGFWEYCRQNTEGFFGEIADTIHEDPTLLPETQDAWAKEVPSIRESTGAPQLEDAHVRQFLSQFRAFNPHDLDDD